MKLNRYLDHTLLRPDATPVDIERLCREAIEHDFCSVVVNPAYLPMVVDLLEGTEIKTGTVVGFPLGANLTEIKVTEALRAAADGADEIDMVANIGWIQAGLFPQVTEELTEVRRILTLGTIIKVIIETPLINPGCWSRAVDAVVRSGADFVKTATGFFGATTRRHVEQLHEYCDGKIKIKAAGGIKTAADAMAMIMAGAERIGSSSSVAIMQDFHRSEFSDG